MKSWIPKRPSASSMGDHDVTVLSDLLNGKRVALMVTGGIAAMKSPMVARRLRMMGAEVQCYVTSEALRYVGRDALEWSSLNPVIDHLSAQAEHLSHSRPFDAYLVAPATYNTINKVAHGLADNAVTTALATALGLMELGRTQILMAPTMHGTLHNRVLDESLRKLGELGVHLIPPRDEYGKHNLPDPEILAAHVAARLSSSPLKGKKFLVTSGSIASSIDDVRTLSNRFHGTLGVKIAQELAWRGAEVTLVRGSGSQKPPGFVLDLVAQDVQDYEAKVLRVLQDENPEFGIFCAAVADFEPEVSVSGKIPSSHAPTLKLRATRKVIDQVRMKFPHLKMISFKFQLQMNHEDLIQIAEERVALGHFAVVANRGEEQGPNGEQVAHWVQKGSPTIRWVSKDQIARGICQQMELHLLRSSSADLILPSLTPQDLQ